MDWTRTCLACQRKAEQLREATGQQKVMELWKAWWIGICQRCERGGGLHGLSDQRDQIKRIVVAEGWGNLHAISNQQDQTGSIG